MTAFYAHLAEGRRDNQRSIDEFDHLVNLGALTAATVIIDGTALTPNHFVAAAAASAKLVWSPQSNLRLYGQTTQVGDAHDADCQSAWVRTGSHPAPPACSPR